MMRRLHLWVIIGVLLPLITALIHDSVFSEWMELYNKKYKTNEELEYRYSIFKKNYDHINGANKVASSWQLGLNQFADLTAQEFKEKYLMKYSLNINHLPPKKLITINNTTTSLPSSFDWRVDNATAVVTSVKDQGSVGTCWAFSTIGNIEGQNALKTNNLIDLSVEYLVDCDGSYDPTSKQADCGVFGGWPSLAYQFIINSGGVPSDDDWPYCCGTGDCYPCMEGPISYCGPPPTYCDKEIPQKCPEMKPVASITSWSDISTNEADIAQALVERGPLSVLLDATELSFYKSGVWTGYISGTSPLLGCKDNLDHAVLLVGFGTDSNGVDYWTVKNSWGESWGENGYFRIIRGQSACGINSAVTTSII